MLTQNRPSVNPYRETREEGGGGNCKDKEEERRFSSFEILLSDLVGKTNGHGTSKELERVMWLLYQGTQRRLCKFWKRRYQDWLKGGRGSLGRRMSCFPSLASKSWTSACWGRAVTRAPYTPTLRARHLSQATHLLPPFLPSLLHSFLLPFH